MNEIEIKNSISKIIFSFLVFFLSGSLFMIINIITWDDNELDINLLGVVLSLLMYFFSTFFLKQIVFNKPLLIINKEGFYDYSSMIATGDRLIKWNEVKDVELTYYGGQSYISVTLRDSYLTLENEDLATRVITDINESITSSNINIMLKYVKKYSDEECLMLMKNAFDEYKRKHAVSYKEDKNFSFLENTLD
ncbi:hypothetical protein KFV05_05945 [Macrococcoides canis]|uniref:STM3941 family protein n=1 Tax=Macrococcoides canis TaxID=1855823 RepID=UPI0020B8FAC2|nr:STM3941 family protein [Macrococcus canis]UTH03522.1 hypothetical protein KFV05_05945 [Macrococcus canis]